MRSSGRDDILPLLELFDLLSCRLRFLLVFLLGSFLRRVLGDPQFDDLLGLIGM
jgi:hypothetical protein